ncbi:TPA: hypothetical protein RJR39_001831 [Burkholderia cenocepacia]|uniref:hypothetical protein n=1 Tax=Burkholderia cenocepacia TaxID=95486 RepID=UPI001B932122|nr:hypothetical protein [Burkholderia cenocepacia]MBR8199162.1 hypothetical protein [Burkholderia cenocepacia]HDV6325783.1 hypothetical protein [Burkholderia cenocepacia]HDV6353642.1 hypothetical protein [Burkholderia cenocepacia]
MSNQSHFAATCGAGRWHRPPPFLLRPFIDLHIATVLQYPVGVAETAAARDLQPGKCRRTAANERLFYVRVPLHAFFNGWAMVGRLRPAGADVPVCKPCYSPAHPNLQWGAGFRNANVGGRILRQSTHARTGQQSHLIQSIVRAALRDAATASTYQDALDATGAALAAIAALVRAEVRHG